MGNTVDPNNQTQPDARAPLTTYADVASRLELSLTDPGLTEEEVFAACEQARSLELAAVLVRPVDVDLAVRVLGGTSVAVGAAAGFPQGVSTTGTKLYEGRDLLRRGAKEVSLAVNPGKMRSRQFQHVETEILQMSESCHQNETTLRIFCPNEYLADDLRIILCKMAKRTDTDWVETDDVAALPALGVICRDVVRRGLYAAAPSLADFEAAYAAGCDRVRSPRAADVAHAWKQVLAEREAAAKQAAAISEGA